MIAFKWWEIGPILYSESVDVKFVDNFELKGTVCLIEFCNATFNMLLANIQRALMQTGLH